MLDCLASISEDRDIVINKIYAATAIMVNNIDIPSRLSERFVHLRVEQNLKSHSWVFEFMTQLQKKFD
jgi:hypothetical protein